MQARRKRPSKAQGGSGCRTETFSAEAASLTIRDFVHRVFASLDYIWWRFDWHFALLPRFGPERAALQIRGSQLLLLHLAANREGVSRREGPRDL